MSAYNEPGFGGAGNRALSYSAGAWLARMRLLTRQIRRPAGVMATAIVLFGQDPTARAADAVAGRKLFEQKCSICHNQGGMGAFMLGRRLGATKSDLTSRTDLPAEYVRQIVRGGLFAMPYFTKVDLTDSELSEIAEYLGNPSARK